MWIKGEYKGFRFVAKCYDEPSQEFGWRGGRISKLEVRKNREIVFNFDRGIDVDTKDPEVQEVLDQIVTIYG